MRRVGLARADESYDAVKKALELIREDVNIPNDRPVLIKPNMVVRNVELCATRVGAVHAALEFLAGLGARDFIIAEGTGTPDGDTLAAFREYGYLQLAARFPVEFGNLHDDKKVLVDAFDAALNPIQIRIAERLLTSYVVSVARMKTHNYVFVTLSLKNVLMAAPVNDYKTSDKGILHGRVKSIDDVMHYNLFHLAERGAWPELAVIDGFESMEGRGPAWGTPLATRLALASRDPLAADIVGTTIMGFDPGRILYLKAMADAGMGQGDPGKVRIVGAPLDECRFKFKVGEKMAEIYQLSQGTGATPGSKERP